MALRTALINVMTNAASKTARRLARDFGEIEQLQVSRKGPADFVSNADLKAEQTLREELGKGRPNFGFIMEESGETPGAAGEPRWVVDPLDGTTNFLHGIPHFAISIGLEDRGEITAAVVFDPIRDEMFWAEKGQGCYLNDRRLRVSARQKMADAVVATGIPHLGRPEHDKFLNYLEPMMGQVAGVRRMGAAALDLAYVAAGRYDGFWETNLNIWDIAAGILLVRESGGMVSDIDGRDTMLQSGNILAANSWLHPAMGKVIRDADRAAKAKTTR